MTPSSEMIELLRQKVAAGETITIEEMKAFITFQRAGRVSALYSSDREKVKKAKKTIPTAQEFLDGLDDI